MFWSLNFWRGALSIRCHPRCLSVAENKDTYGPKEKHRKGFGLQRLGVKREAVEFRRAEGAVFVFGLSSGARIDLYPAG